MDINLNDPARWDDPFFPVAVAAAASTTDAATLRMWFARGNVRLQPEMGDDEAATAGVARMLSLRSVLTIAATAALARSSVPVKQAFDSARAWTFFAHARPNDPDRIPAGLFADPAWTFLVHAPAAQALVLPIEPDKKTGALPFDFSDLFATGHPVRQSPTIVFLNNIDRYARGVCEGFLR